MGKRRSEIGNLEENPQVFARRERRRRNCLTETTRTWRCRRALIKSRSRLRSSSRVTRYCDWPRIAASKISSSSGSRQIFRSPEISITFARAAMSRTNVSTSSGGYLNRRVNRGRLRTSAISASCEKDVTTLKSSRRHLVITCPGGPVGLRNADTQTLVSSRATSGTAFRLDLGPRSSYLCLENLLWNPFGANLHSAKQAFELVPPVALSVEGNQDARLLLQPKWPHGLQHPILVHCTKRFFRWLNSFGQRHGTHYTDAPAFRQAALLRSCGSQADRPDDSAQRACAGR